MDQEEDRTPGPTVRPLHDVHGVRRGAGFSAWRSHRRPARVPDTVPFKQLRTEAPVRSRLVLLTTAVLKWAWNYVKYVFRFRYPFPTYEKLAKRTTTAAGGDAAGVRNGIIPMTGSTIALAADWASGTASAHQVAKSIDALSPDYTIHLGDVYYSGTSREFADYFLPPAWPRGTLGTFALNGNHEMYSGGKAYFQALTQLTHRVGGQPAEVAQDVSYFCLENDFWRVLAIDTGYYSRSFPFLELFDTHLIRLHNTMRIWLRTVVFADANDRRPVILLSHHNWFSAYDSEYTRIGRQLSPYLGRVLLWFWGHEHRFSGYAPFGFKDRTVRARCIGHGGVPFDVAYPKRNRQLIFSDERVNCESTNAIHGKQELGYCGFAFLRFERELLIVQYYDETYDHNELENGTAPHPLLEERWTWNPSSATATATIHYGERLTTYEDRVAPAPPERICGGGGTRLHKLGGEWRPRAPDE